MGQVINLKVVNRCEDLDKSPFIYKILFHEVLDARVTTFKKFCHQNFFVWPMTSSIVYICS